MDKELEQLINIFKESPELENQKNIEKYYIKNFQNREYIQKELLIFIEKDNSEKKLDWSFFFNFDTYFQHQIILAEQKYKASERLFLCLSIDLNNRDIFFTMVADLGSTFYNQIKEDINENIADKTKNIWLETFSKYPIFLETWKENELRKIEIELDLKKNEYPQQETIQTLEIKVPLETKDYNGNNIDIDKLNFIQESPEYIKFMNDRINFFNNFNLHSYLEIPECHSLKMKIEDSNNIFTFEINKEIDLEKLKKALYGQLSDGLGSNLSQKPLLIKDQIYYFDFNYQNASNIYPIEKKSKRFKL